MKGSPFVIFAGGVIGVIVAGYVFRWLVRHSKTPAGQELVVAIMLALLVIDASLYENPSAVPTGLFHPQVGSLSFRIFDVLVPLVIAAQFIARPPKRPSSGQPLLWGGCLAWILFAAFEGIAGGNPKDYVTFEAKVVIYIGVLMLVAKVPVHRLVDSRAIRRVVVMSSAIAALLLVTNEAKVAIAMNLPLIPVQDFGVLGTDAATIFGVLGLITLAVGACSERGRLRALVVALPLLAAPFAAGQRAAIAGLLASILVLLIAAPRLRQCVRVTGTEIGLLLAAVGGCVAALVIVAGLTHASLPFVQQLQDTFASRGKQLSADDRINQWSQARALIAARPWFGWGLGETYQFYSPGFYQFMTTDLTHNITLDLLVRSGVVGLALFIAASISTIRDYVLAVIREAEPRTVALAAACLAAFVGLVTKGQFESIFEKYRLALLLGALVGVSISFAAERVAATVPERRRTPTLIDLRPEVVHP
jgi:O-antigen ligase